MTNSQDFLTEQHRLGNIRDTRRAMESEDGGVADMVAALSSTENYRKAECVVKILNAFNLSKLTQTGNAEWTVDDLRAFSFAVRALGTSWELTEKGKVS